MKKRKARKQPKISASLETWKKYHDHVKEVNAYNKKLEADRKKKYQVISQVKKIK